MAENKYIEEANKKLQNYAINFLEKFKTQPVAKKRKEVKGNLKSPRFSNVNPPSPETEPPSHCWSIEKVLIKGVWYTPQYPWNCLNIQQQGGQAFLNNYQSTNSNPYPMRGPFTISNLGPSTSGNITIPPFNTIAWKNLFDSSAFYRADATQAFYDWVTNHPNNGTAPVAGDYITLQENGPDYINASSIDQNFPSDPIEAWCLQYHGKLYYGANGYEDTYVLLDAGHNNDVAGIPSLEVCQTPIQQNDPSECLEIGDINPETGGIVFAINQGPNGDEFYEVAPSDVILASDVNGNPITLGPGGTPSNVIGTSDCGIHSVDPINITIDTQIITSGVSNQGYTATFPSSLTTPDQGATWYWNGNLIDLSPGTPVSAVDANGVSVFPTGTAPTIVSVTYFAPNIIYIIFDTTMLGPFQSQPADSITISTTSTTVSQGSGWVYTGLEWGVYGRQVAPTSTLANFGSGKKNTDIIDAYTQYPTPPFGHPVIDSRHIAAEEALKYDTNQIGLNQIPLAEEESWFLPSLDEFLTMIANVGPTSSLWGNNLTQAQTDFINSFYNHTSVSSNISSNVYWTSSENDANSNLNLSGISSYSGNDPENFAIAVRLGFGSQLSFQPTPLFTSRCHPLTVRPIRRFKCVQEPERLYNFRDSHNIWVENDGKGGTAGGGQQALTPFVNIYSPGNAASGKVHTDFSTQLKPEDPGVIGAHEFELGLASTDVMFNEFEPQSFANDNNGRNPNGFIITIWDNQKNYVGKWHYARSVLQSVRENRINYRGYLTECNPGNPNHISSGPNQNCNPNPTYANQAKEFPKMYNYRFTHVTHLDGPHPVFRYGGNREELKRRFWPQGANNGIPFTDWHHPYMENVFNGWTSSYAYIKIECDEVNKIPQTNRYNNLDTGNNTGIDTMEVICLKNLFEDSYTVENDSGVLQTWTPPNPNLNPTTGSILGCGDISNHTFNDANSPGGGYGWQLNNPTQKGNSAFGDLYGINYVDGRKQETGYSPHGQSIPNLSMHPKHYAFIWHAAQKPNSGGVNWFQDLHIGYENCYGYRCHYKLGDIGPAGGIIVGVPDMIGNEIVPGGASTNESEWYYEMSPIDLHMEYYYSYEFGVFNSTTSYPNIPMSADGNLAYGPNSTGGNLNQSFSYDNPYSIIGSGIAETTLYPQGLLNINPVGGPYFANNARSAFRLCEEYFTVDKFGNKYCDWYLPNIQEAWYIMNNAPAGTFTLSTDTHDHKRNLYWTSNELDSDGNYHPSPYGWDQLKGATMFDHGGYFVKGVPANGQTHLNSAYAYNVAEKVKKQGPITTPVGPSPTPVLNWQPLSNSTRAAYVVDKGSALGVRAIRRFKCPKPGIQGGVSGT